MINMINMNKMMSTAMIAAFMLALPVGTAGAAEYPALLQVADEEADSRGAVTLFEAPGPGAKAAGRIGAWDDAVALGERTVDGAAWYEADHPARKRC